MQLGRTTPKISNTYSVAAGKGSQSRHLWCDRFADFGAFGLLNMLEPGSELAKTLSMVTLSRPRLLG